ncbi:MAG: PQQ-dependent sugar dehydrogenase [Anaerolineales bacterium]
MIYSNLPYHPSRSGKRRGLFAALAFLAVLSLATAGCGALTGLPAHPVIQTTQPAQTASIPATTETSSAQPAPSTTTQPIPTVTQNNPVGFPDPGGYAWEPVVTGLNLPVDIQNAGDGSGRLFIVEKSGRILILQNGQLLSTPFLDIQARVDSRGTEQGLLGLAFHPNYAQYGTFFVNYIDLNGNTVIARFHVSTGDPNWADPSSEVDILRIHQPYPNHNGGGLAFGPDGMLYAGLGDGGSEGDPNRTGQNLGTLLGKLLRINVNSGATYGIPPDNPFAAGGGQPEIWVFGLRNPWRFSFDRLTGDLYIADVGQDKWEEVDFIPAGTPGGLNFGWSYYEGLHPYQDQPPVNATFTWPVAEYSHADGCAVTGGYVYRGVSLPEWRGVYFFGDYCSGTVWGLIHSNGNTFQMKTLFQTGARITTFGLDEAGEIYLVDYGSGTLLRLMKRS